MDKIFRLFSLTFLVSLIIGCAGTTDRGSLREAMDKSKDDHTGDRRVENSRETDTSSGGTASCLFGFFSSSETNADPETPRSSASENNNPGFFIPGRHYVGIRAASSNRYSRNYTHSAGGAIIWLDHYREKRSFDMSFQFEGITTGEKSPLFGSLDGLRVVSIGLHTRYFSTPDHAIMGLYFKWGIDVSEMFWEYRNPLTSDVYDDQNRLLRTDVIHFDGLTGFSADAGAGWSFLQTKNTKLSLEALFGGTLFWFKTYQGFSNDMFPPDAYIKCDLEILISNGG